MIISLINKVLFLSRSKFHEKISILLSTYALIFSLLKKTFSSRFIVTIIVTILMIHCKESSNNSNDKKKIFYLSLYLYIFYLMCPI